MATPSPLIAVHVASPDHIEVELDWYDARCTLFCRFCPMSWSTDRERAPAGPGRHAEVVSALLEAVADHPGADVSLAAGDVLRAPWLFDALDRLGAQGRRVHLVTPGVDLADRAFAARFVGRDVRFDLTVLSTDEATWQAMVGAEGVGDRLSAALDHLDDLGLAYEIGVVVTADNVQDLARLVAWLHKAHGVGAVTVRAFFPDADEMPDGYLDQVVPYGALLEQLEALEAWGLDDPPRINLGNVPLCQVDLSGLSTVRVFPLSSANRFGAEAHPLCPLCPERDVCSQLPRGYRARHPLRTVDLDHVRAMRAHIEAQPRDQLVVEPREPPGVDPVLQERLADGTDLWFVVEPRRDGERYWFDTGRLGVLYTDDPDHPVASAVLHRVMSRLRRRLDGVPPARVGLPVLRKVWVAARRGVAAGLARATAGAVE